MYKVEIVTHPDPDYNALFLLKNDEELNNFLQLCLRNGHMVQIVKIEDRNG